MGTKVISLVDHYYNTSNSVDALPWAMRHGGMQIKLHSQEALEAVRAHITSQAQESGEEVDMNECNDLSEAVENNSNGSAKLTICYDRGQVNDSTKSQGFVSFSGRTTYHIFEFLLTKYGRPCVERSNITCMYLEDFGEGKANNHWSIWSNEVLVDHNGNFIEAIQP